MIRTYYRLAKPGIVYGNALVAIGGYFLAADGHLDLPRFAAALAGICLVMASGCVFNNYLDRDIDRKMVRTSKRASATGAVSGPALLTYGAALGFLGLSCLAQTNPLTVRVAVFGWVAYVVAYGIAKRRSVWGTVIGSVSGAVPPVVGYCAVSGRLDLAALLLFFILVFWQMPHFYAIAIFRSDDYAAAGIPVLPAVRGLAAAKRHIFWCVAAYAVTVATLTFAGYAGYVFLLVMLLLNLRWLQIAYEGFSATDEIAWSRKLFRFSLLLLTALCLGLSLSFIFP